MLKNYMRLIQKLFRVSHTSPKKNVGTIHELSLQGFRPTHIELMEMSIRHFFLWSSLRLPNPTRPITASYPR
jgi:hypothetical protein